MTSGSERRSRGPARSIGIGLNYRDHAAAAGTEVPARPAVFLKPSSTICGPHDMIELPPGSTATDYEVELGVVLGRPLKGCTDRAGALAAVGGYVAVNDVTERALARGRPHVGEGQVLPTRSRRSGPGWSPPTRWPTRRRSGSS